MPITKVVKTAIAIEIAENEETLKGSVVVASLDHMLTMIRK